MKIAPILIVDEIEPSLRFWVDKLGFVILQKDGSKVMLQYRASDDFGGALRRVLGEEVLIPDRTTFYGMREIVVREPGQHVVGFAARAAQPAAHGV